MITGRQIRAARGAVNWSVKELADAANVGTATIARFEALDDVPPNRGGSLGKVKLALEAAGIEFTGTPDNRPGIVMRV